MDIGAVGLVVAQNIAEYGALAGAAATLQSMLSRVEAAVQEPRNAVPLAVGVVVAAYLLLRRRA